MRKPSEQQYKALRALARRRHNCTAGELAGVNARSLGALHVKGIVDRFDCRVDGEGETIVRWSINSKGLKVAYPEPLIVDDEPSQILASMIDAAKQCGGRLGAFAHPGTEEIPEADWNRLDNFLPIMPLFNLAALDRKASGMVSAAFCDAFWEAYRAEEYEREHA